MKHFTQFILWVALAASAYGQGVGGNSVPRTASGISAALDLISSTQGTVFYRGAAGWEALAPGTSGQLLATSGAGANPSWVSATGGAGNVSSGAATDNAIARYDTSSGQTIQNSAVTIADTTGSIRINGTDTAISVDSGGFRSANFGLSTVSGGASYFGGALDISTATNDGGVTIRNSTNSNELVRVYRDGGVDRGNIALFAGGAATVIMRGDGTTTWGKPFSVTATTASTGLGTGALQVAGGIYAGAASVFGGAATFEGAVTIAGTVIHTLSATPASASAAGTVGTMSWDANYIYICTATNTWKRVAIATW